MPVMPRHPWIVLAGISIGAFLFLFGSALGEPPGSLAAVAIILGGGLIASGYVR